MKLFERTVGHYLIWCGVTYLISAFAAQYTVGANGALAVSIFWLVAMCLPLFSRSVATFLNTETLIDFHKKKSEVAPQQETFTPLIEPSVQSPAPHMPAKKEAECHYTVGLDTNGDVVLKVRGHYGVTTLTMNSAAARQMIRLLEAAIIDQ